MDSPVSHSLADRERITMRSLPPFLFSSLCSSFRPTARSPISLSLSSRPSAKSVRLSIRSSLRLPPVTLLASLSRRFSRIRNSSPLLSCALSSSSVAPFVPSFVLLVTTVVILVPPQLFLSFPISPDFFKILSSGSLERDRNRDREEGWILESSAYHMRNEHYSHSGTLRTRTISWMGFRECGGGKGARKGREKGCWKRAELGVHRWSALGPLLGSGPIPTDPRMPFASRGPPVVVFLVLVVDAVILAILSSPSSLREREGLPSNRSRPSGGLWLEGPWTAPGRERQWTMGT